MDSVFCAISGGGGSKSVLRRLWQRNVGNGNGNVEVHKLVY
jgi:hypothetical protein